MSVEAVNEAIQGLADGIEGVLAKASGEREIVDGVAEVLAEAFANGFDIPEKYKVPGEKYYVMYPLYIDKDEKFCIASAVWGVGQVTPIHDHGVWGVVGILDGVEQEERFAPPEAPGPVQWLGEESFGRHEVTVCCTSDRDLHRVQAGGDQPCVGIHIYGGNIWKIARRGYNAETGAVSYFTSSIPEAS